MVLQRGVHYTLPPHFHCIPLGTCLSHKHCMCARLNKAVTYNLHTRTLQLLPNPYVIRKSPTINNYVTTMAATRQMVRKFSVKNPRREVAY